MIVCKSATNSRVSLPTLSGYIFPRTHDSAFSYYCQYDKLRHGIFLEMLLKYGHDNSIKGN